MWRIVHSIPVWICMIVIKLFFGVLGFIVVPIGVLFKAYHIRESEFYDKQVLSWTWDFLWPWGNEEEGIGWYGDKAWPLWRKIIYSECIRNASNNLRYVPGLAVVIDPKRVGFVGSLGNSDQKYLAKDVVMLYDSDDHTFWSFTWHGMYANLRFHFNFRGTRYRWWIGHKIYPGDCYGIPDWDHRKVSAGFTNQFKRI